MIPKSKFEFRISDMYGDHTMEVCLWIFYFVCLTALLVYVAFHFADVWQFLQSYWPIFMSTFDHSDCGPMCI